jgi:Zn-dependent peptidase ImmA (M78 family)/transcriptional regulator with XRE-family HTH domain
MTHPINPQMVTLARESRGLTQSELASRMGDRQAKVSKIESGLIGVTSDTLKSLSVAVDYPEEFFYQRDELHGIDTSILFHRRRQAIPSRLLAKIHAAVNIQRIHAQRFLKAVDLEPAKPFPRFDIVEFGGDPAAVAQAVRATWILPRGPVANVTKTIEDAGGIVIKCDFETRMIDAVSQWIAGYPPMFFVSDAIPGDRLRWTLAHEIGHVVMHRTVSSDIEDEADAFASSFLMPADDIRPYFVGSVTAGKLAELKPYWKVSMASLLKRASDLGVMSERQARYLWMQFGKAGYRTREPEYLDVPVEQPNILQQLVTFHTANLGYSTRNLASLLNLNEDELRERYLRAREPGRHGTAASPLRKVAKRAP